MATARQSGLTAAEVAERVERGQTNALRERTSRSLGEIFRANVLTRFNAILGALFVLVMATGSFADGLFGIVLVVNSGIGIVQEYLAKRKLDRLALLHAPRTRVIRDGERRTIATHEVVRDELVELHAGDQVPADGRLLDAIGLELDESNLTGEADPVHRAAGDEARSGTTVVAGMGRFRARAVGPDAYVNRVAAQARRFTHVRSEIDASIDRLLVYITWVIVLALPLQIASQWHTVGGEGWRAVVLRSAAGLVGLVPEGLVLLTSIAFLVSAVRLTREQVLVQQLPAVEGLARVDVVCLDKTGTLTMGDIAFEKVEPIDDAPDEPLREALGALADDPNRNGTLAAIGAALAPARGWERTGTIPFTSERKWSAGTFAGRGTWLLGAPEVLLPDGSVGHERAAELAATGRRVMALAQSGQHLREPSLPDDLRVTGLVLLNERVREDAGETLRYFAEQEVSVKVVSGDNPRTVAAIARRVGLDAGEPIDARELGDDAAALRDAVRDRTVFGRVSPEQKRAIVQALQAEGHVVAMTGDGINDALALKVADIGVAMGNGAQATKAVAELVLLDGRFAHLPTALLEGRRVLGNVERVANLFIAKNAMSLVAIVAVALASTAFPFLPRQLTLVSAVTIGVPAFFLALGPNPRRYEPGLLGRVLRFAVPAGAVAGLSVIASYLVAGRRYGPPKEEFLSRCTLAVEPIDPSCRQPGTGATITLLVVFFWILAVQSRPFRLWKGALFCAMALLAVLAFLVPAVRRFLTFSAPPLLVWESLAVGAVGAVIVELIHRVVRRGRA